MSKASIKHLDNQHLLQALRQRPGLIPVDIDLEAERLIWLDMGQYHIYEGRFRSAVNTCAAMNQQFSQSQTANYFSCAMDFLDLESLSFDSLYPSGFIFHMSRCGSTLLSKALAQSRNNLVFGEATPHSKFWQFLGKDQPSKIENTPENQCRFRNLLLLMGRKRVDTHQYHFIKFTSIHTLFIDIIMAAFPDVPTLFLYRNPEEVLVSLSKKGTGWDYKEQNEWSAFITGDSQCDSSLQYFSHTLSHCLSNVMNMDSLPINYLNYRYLKAEHLPSMLSFFRASYKAEEIKRMQAQFSQYSKSDYKSKSFVPDSNKKQKAVTPEMTLLNKKLLQQPYQQLLDSDKNMTFLT